MCKHFFDQFAERQGFDPHHRDSWTAHTAVLLQQHVCFPSFLSSLFSLLFSFFVFSCFFLTYDGHVGCEDDKENVWQSSGSITGRLSRDSQVGQSTQK